MDAEQAWMLMLLSVSTWSLQEVGSEHLHGLLEHDITEDELHEVFCGRLKLAVHVA